MLNIVKKIFFYLVLFYGFLGFIILPLVLKPKLIEILSQEINAKVEIGSIYINPFVFKLELSEVLLKSLQDEELLRFKEFNADFELYSLFRKAIHFSSISLVEPKISLVYNTDKTFNLLNILKEKEEIVEEDKSSVAIPRIILDTLSVKNGEVKYRDYTLKRPFSFSFNTIGFDLRDVDTDESKGSNARARFYTTLGDGGFVDFRSNIESLASFKATGRIDFEASKLYTEWKYVQDILNLEVADGKISFNAEYAFALDDINATKIDKLNLSVEKLRIKPKAKTKDIFNIEKLTIENATVLPILQHVNIEKVSLDGLRVLAKRDSSGVIDWVKYIEINKETSSTIERVETKDASLQESKTVKPWDVNLSDISLLNITLKLEDESVSPKVDTELSRLNIYAQNVTLAGEEALNYQMDMQLNKKGVCNSQGSITHKKLDVESFFECKGIDIVHYNPYIENEANKVLQAYNIDLKSASLNFNASAHLQKNDEKIDLLVSGANLALNSLHIHKKNKKHELLGFSNFLINGIDLDTTKREIELEKITLNGFNLNAKKYKNGSLNLENLVVPKNVKKTQKIKTTKTEQNPYSVKLKHFALNSSSVSFIDYSLQNRAVNRLSSIYANAYDLDLKEYSWLRYDLALKVNSQGRVKSKGKLRHTPLMQSGSFDIKNLSLVALTPYLQESAYVSVEDGKLSLEGKTTYQKNTKDADLRVEGSISLDSFFVNDTLNQTQLLSLGDLKVKSYTFELNPNRAYIDEVEVSSFYIDASLDVNKTLNFSKLIKKEDINTSSESSQKEEVRKKTQQSKEPSFPYRILKVNVALGSAKFADYSIPIKFATHIHDLGGTIYSISNAVGDTTYIDIAGEVDKYASTKLKGSIDSANPKAYTDLELDFKNLDLNSFTGYSANFAGHEIDSGKLYLDLGYNILNSQLLGRNSVMIKKIKLGREVEDENVTVLPLGFVIGLLEDSDGVIDIDMPVEGDLDAPDFKYGTLVFKTFANLITKAVTSPFKFLGAAMGLDAEALEFIAYEAGSSDITPPQREKLDKIAELMLKKPKISLGVAGVYELQKDKEALQLSKLVDLVVKKSGLKNIKDHESAMSIDMLEDIYEEMRDDDVLSKTQKHLHASYKDEASYDRAYQNELIELCRDLQVVAANELMSLADVRADTIVNYLIQDKMIDAKRVERKASIVREGDSDTFVKINMEIEVK